MTSILGSITISSVGAAKLGRSAKSAPPPPSITNKTVPAGAMKVHLNKHNRLYLVPSATSHACNSPSADTDINSRATFMRFLLMYTAQSVLEVVGRSCLLDQENAGEIAKLAPKKIRSTRNKILSDAIDSVASSKNFAKSINALQTTVQDGRNTCSVMIRVVNSEKTSSSKYTKNVSVPVTYSSSNFDVTKGDYRLYGLIHDAVNMQAKRNPFQQKVADFVKSAMDSMSKYGGEWITDKDITEHTRCLRIVSSILRALMREKFVLTRLDQTFRVATSDELEEFDLGSAIIDIDNYNLAANYFALLSNSALIKDHRENGSTFSVNDEKGTLWSEFVSIFKYTVATKPAPVEKTA